MGNSNKIQSLWNERYAFVTDAVSFDGWIKNTKVEEKIPQHAKILDLGCGLCPASSYLLDYEFDFFALDFSVTVLKKLAKQLPKCNLIAADLSGMLPFASLSFDLVISDLSLHYFDLQTTQDILCEVGRVLKPDGMFLMRLNSSGDYNFGAGKGEALEKGFYRTASGETKRFFDGNEFPALLGRAWQYSVRETTFNRNGVRKCAWEVYAQKAIR